jgi:hypothetical protein
MWDYYLAYCEGAMRARHCGVVQMVLAKPLARPTGAWETPRASGTSSVAGRGLA